MKKVLQSVFLMLLAGTWSIAQQIPNDWHLLDPQTDGVQGLSVERAYNTLLKGKPAKTVIVAVIDSGIDPEHEDLKPVIWTNPREVEGNGKDDDGNGYVDDIHGWSFISGKGGEIGPDTYELTREYVRLESVYGNMDPANVPKKERENFAYYTSLKAKFEEKYANDKQQYEIYGKFYSNLRFAVDTLKSILGKGPFTTAALEGVKSTSPVILFAKSMLLQFLSNSPGGDLESMVSGVKEGYDYYRNTIEHGLNTSFNPRPIVGDNYADKTERNYGTASVQGPDAEHGTHVAGIIAAVRDNNIGIRGIADHARIMILRAVPDGDERDKDIANAIYYAANNGARIINMSFGKEYSPDKKFVDDAVRYAEAKGVLFIHAAGNDSKDIDASAQFPSRSMLTGRPATAWVEVGASGPGNDENLPAEFSNFGKKNVDLFSPGVDIYSTIPGGGYKNNSGTSMAAPAVSGVAAMLMSYFPDFSAAEIREILLASVRRFEGLKVNRPGTTDLTTLSELCATGGMVNAYEAVKVAMGRKPGTVRPR